MIEKIKKYWSLVVIAATIIGWLTTYIDGQRAEAKQQAEHAAEVEYLRKQVELSDKKWETQLKTNESMALSIEHLSTIVEILTDEL